MKKLSFYDLCLIAFDNKIFEAKKPKEKLFYRILKKSFANARLHFIENEIFESK